MNTWLFGDMLWNHLEAVFLIREYKRAAEKQRHAAMLRKASGAWQNQNPYDPNQL